MKKFSDSENWTRYQALMEQRPSLFKSSTYCSIIADPARLDDFQGKTGKSLGVVYQSPYNTFLADLVEDPDGQPYVYDRLVPTHEGAVVAVPQYHGRYVLLRQFRHAIRRDQWAFPRGFGEPGLTPEENCRKELREELGTQCSSVEPLNTISADSGIASTELHAYLCQVEDIHIPPGYEGIEDVVFLSEAELKQWIREGRIDDSFTLACFGMLMSRV